MAASGAPIAPNFMAITDDDGHLPEELMPERLSPEALEPPVDFVLQFENALA